MFTSPDSLNTKGNLKKHKLAVYSLSFIMSVEEKVRKQTDLDL